MARLAAWWQGLAAREQRVVVWGGAFAAVLVWLAVQWPLQRRVAALQASVAAQRADLAWVQANAGRLAALGPVSLAAPSNESLLARVDRSAREAGLGAALSGSQPAADGALRIQLQQARFDVVVAWLARLANEQGVTIDTATMDGAGEPGLVNATLVLHSR